MNKFLIKAMLNKLKLFDHILTDCGTKFFNKNFYR